MFLPAILIDSHWLKWWWSGRSPAAIDVHLGKVWFESATKKDIKQCTSHDRVAPKISWIQPPGFQWSPVYIRLLFVFFRWWTDVKSSRFTIYHGDDSEKNISCSFGSMTGDGFCRGHTFSGLIWVHVADSQNRCSRTSSISRWEFLCKPSSYIQLYSGKLVATFSGHLHGLYTCNVDDLGKSCPDRHGLIDDMIWAYIRTIQYYPTLICICYKYWIWLILVAIISQLLIGITIHLGRF